MFFFLKCKQTRFCWEKHGKTVKYADCEAAYTAVNE